MKQNRRFLKSRGTRWITVILLIAAVLVWRTMLRHTGCSSEQHQQSKETSQHNALEGKTQMYYCSMHPQVRSPDPNDKCPICFMALIPLPGDDEDSDDETDVPRLRISSRAAALMDIRTWPVERRQVEIEVDLFGKVGFDESRLFDVVARTEAYVEKLTVNTPWQHVIKGDVLAELYSPAVVTAFRELLLARDGKTDSLDASRARLIRRGVSEAQIDDVLKSGEAPKTFSVKSPATGTALPALVREGEWLREGGLLNRIADLSRVWVNLEAYEHDLTWLTAGQQVHFSVTAYPGDIFEGKVIFIDPVINSRTRTARLRVESDNSNGRLKPDMLVSAKVNAVYTSSDDSRENGNTPLVVPASAPLITGQRALVYVRISDEERPSFEPRQVVLGPRAGDVYIVREGLNEGDLVVVNGQFKIDSELQIRGRPSMMAPEGGRPPSHDHGQAANIPPSPAEKGSGDGHDSHAGHEPRLQTHCPIMDGEINRDFYHDHDGQRIYVCCPGCLTEVRNRTDEIIEEQRKKGIVFEKVSK